MKDIENILTKNYPAGFETKIESENVIPGINEKIIKLISKKKNEPKFLLEFRLKT